MLNKNVLAFVVALGLMAGIASADENVLGFVKIVEGEASITNAQATNPALPGAALYLGNILKTGENGKLGVTFKDNTVMSFGPDTEVTIDEYLYDPAKGDLKLMATMIKGTMHYISGVIAKLKPEAVTVKTPAGIIGVRGTRFLVKAEAE